MKVGKNRIKAHEQNVQVLARNFPRAVNVPDLEVRLHRLALKCEYNAENLCNIDGYVDKRDELWKTYAKICKTHNVEGMRAQIGGDPRGFCLKLFLPDGTYNSWGGVEAGYGIGRSN